MEPQQQLGRAVSALNGPTVKVIVEINNLRLRLYVFWRRPASTVRPVWAHRVTRGDVL